MADRIPTFYLLHGPDEFSRRAYLDSMRRKMGDPTTAELNTVVLDGKSASAAEVLASARAIPFLSDKRLVIVDGMLTWLARRGAGKTGKVQLDLLCEQLPTLPDWARVVFIEPETLPEKHPILELVRTTRGGFQKLFEAPRDATAWIENQARTVYGATIETSAARALAAVIEHDLRAADSELAKLAAYVNGERPITEADVSLLTAYAAEPDVFVMVDALGRRDSAAALRLLHRLLAGDDPLRLFGMIVRQFRLLILAREYLNTGGSAQPRDMSKAIGVHPYVAEKLAGQVRQFTLDQLESIYHSLLEADVGIKTGKVDGVLALDMLVAGLAGESERRGA